MKRNWIGYRILTHTSLLILIAAFITSLVRGNVVGVAILAAFIAITVMYIRFTKKTPAVIDAVFSGIIMLNAIEFVWNIYNWPGPYDEIAHFCTAFAVTFIFAYLATIYLKKLGLYTKAYILILASVGLSIGTLWEIGEWAIDRLNILPFKLVHSLDDTITDLMFDAAGALLAGCMAHIILKIRKDDAV